MKAKSILHSSYFKYTLLGIAAGIIPSVMNQLGAFWKFSVLAQTASQSGFWVIFVALIIAYSRARKQAVLNVVLFCTAMVIVYTAVESIFVSLSPNPVNFFDYFVENTNGNIYWYGVIVMLIPVSMIIFSAIHSAKLPLKIFGSLFIIAPLAMAILRLATTLQSEVVVCADLANGWSASLCTFQSPDAWIITNKIIETVIYLAFCMWWLWFVTRPKHPTPPATSTPPVSSGASNCERRRGGRRREQPGG